MKILELTNGYPTVKAPLQGIFEKDQAFALKDGGEDVLICAVDMRSIRRFRKFGITEFNDGGLPVFRLDFPLGRVGFFIKNQVSWLMFKKAYKKILTKWGKPDIIHAHFVRASGYIAYKAKKAYGVDYVITEHDSSVNNDVINAAERKLLCNIYDNAKACVAVSLSFRKRLTELYNRDFVYIPNVIDIEAFKPLDNCCRQDCINFVSVGNMHDNGKGMDVTIKAFAQATDKCDKIGKLLIIGDGAERNKLENLAKTIGMKDKVIFKGAFPRKNINEVFSQSDVFVLASRSETFGVVYIEAMCAGLPVIATRCGGPEGIFTDNEGLLVDVDSVEQTADAMCYMAENIEKYNSQEIREFCIKNYSPRVVAETLLKIFKSKLNVHSPI